MQLFSVHDCAIMDTKKFTLFRNRKNNKIRVTGMFLVSKKDVSMPITVPPLLALQGGRVRVFGFQECRGCVRVWFLHPYAFSLQPVLSEKCTFWFGRGTVFCLFLVRQFLIFFMFFHVCILHLRNEKRPTVAASHRCNHHLGSGPRVGPAFAIVS